jgi:hypothetical protein
LACYARAGAAPASLCAVAAERPIAEIAAWIGCRVGIAAAAPRDAVAGLVGLGPGLTPSGDDFLAGSLLALRLAGRRAAARGLWRAIAACGVQATNAISFSHLRSAAKGRVGENLHLVFDAIITDDWTKTGTRLGRLLDLGHSSPWDAIAGFATSVRAIAGDGQRGGLAKA